MLNMMTNVRAVSYDRLPPVPRNMDLERSVEEGYSGGCTMELESVVSHEEVVEYVMIKRSML